MTLLISGWMLAAAWIFIVLSLAPERRTVASFQQNDFAVIVLIDTFSLLLLIPFRLSLIDRPRQRIITDPRAHGNE
jgi:hypothetical protein